MCTVYIPGQRWLVVQQLDCHLFSVLICMHVQKPSLITAELYPVRCQNSASCEFVSVIISMCETLHLKNTLQQIGYNSSGHNHHHYHHHHHFNLCAVLTYNSPGSFGSNASGHLVGSARRQ